ncbi:enolase C-terminal domain-like protein [Thelonectria olida]|uniref:Enolase C-terminal domain-like protein n=1 Tax=Thelonectria olida TaxID=1576542 RepID=A0A9P8VNR6_9HYPO|nr:enolase C-terminal domain-like protein [Thelonectria olida]
MKVTEDLGWLDSPGAPNSSVERPKKARLTDLDVAMDFHGRVHKGMAKQLPHKLEPFEPLFTEEPLLPENVEGVQALLKPTTIPIALRERLHSHWDFKRYFKLAAIDIVQPGCLEGLERSFDNGR